MLFSTFADYWKLERQRMRLAIIVLLGILMIVLAAWVAYKSIAAGPLWWLLFGLIALTGGVGLLLRKPWSQYPVFAVAASEVGLWFYAVARVALEGWPYADPLNSIISLVPGIMLLVICVGGSVVVRQYFVARASAA
jgi:hypothetical protein